MPLRRHLLATLAALGLAAALPRPVPAAEPGAEAMIGHRAAYKLTLDKVRDNSDIARAEGVMLYEVVDACDGWATRQRFQLRITDRDGQDVETTSDYSTFETKDGKKLRFSLTQTSQGAVSQRIAGDAETTPEGGTVKYTEPEAKEETLPEGTLLPMLHTIRSLAAARAGSRMLVVPLFDGTSAEGAQDTTTVISAWTPPQANARFPDLAKLGSARMRVAFFDRDKGSDAGGASAPDYEVGLRYFENGVADDLKMDFGEFSVDGKLQELSILPNPC
ncbi:cell envelope integrity EipB family protein [Paracraurococcus lichenis]|uniref:Cell envelope integrity EipB family protein n=1 Tax=Paracraurococcus lichenis TaxID=3064888 RepID=A0ABT9E2V0_9PROT|nr:cell envelope integrity EipB family protein [Paracraurococcus sp. LOR1-02]MDO9710485.1 cell envelope integrity EipB family protein [Paracraurococcus sp. LOR1-02]